jgi:dienelactone hydrolase
MAHVVLFHSVLGLRPAELLAAERLRRSGHEVVVPDLFGGETAATLDAGFRIAERVGWAAVVTAARATLRGMPDETVLAGVLLLHGVTDLPVPVRPGLRVQLHAAVPDTFAPDERVAELGRAARAYGVALDVFRYPGSGHFYTDPGLPDHDPAAADLTWRRVLDWLR